VTAIIIKIDFMIYVSREEAKQLLDRNIFFQD